MCATPLYGRIPSLGTVGDVRQSGERIRAKENEMLSIHELFGWLRVEEYERAKAEADENINARQSRGNTLSQDGGAATLTARVLKIESEAADKDMVWLAAELRAYL